MTTKFRIFDKIKTITIRDELVHQYETFVAPINSHRIEYFIASSPESIHAPEHHWESIIEDAIVEEINVCKAVEKMMETI